MSAIGVAPLISVVMTFLNGRKFIQEAIESVLSQTYGNWELLLVDDGSSDAATEIAMGFANRHAPRIQYLEHPGHQTKGTGVSRNLGTARSSGTLVAFIDVDDVWFPAKLEQQAEILERHPNAAMVYGPALMWHSWTGKQVDLTRDFVPGKHAGLLNTVVEPPRLLPLLLRDECVEPFLSGVLVRRGALERVGGFDNIHRPMFNDTILYVKLFAGFPVYVADTCWFKYRRHPESLTQVAEATGLYHPAILSFREWSAAYLWRLGLKDEAVWAVLRSELGPYRHPLAYRITKLARKLPAPEKRFLKRIVRLLQIIVSFRGDRQGGP